MRFEGAATKQKRFARKCEPFCCELADFQWLAAHEGTACPKRGAKEPHEGTACQRDVLKGAARGQQLLSSF